QRCSLFFCSDPGYAAGAGFDYPQNANAAPGRNTDFAAPAAVCFATAVAGPDGIAHKAWPSDK
ncbi:MAG: hypothetical protein ACK5YO_36930, partial [Planctomyces sp.]